MTQQLHTVAIDLAKKVFHLVGADTTGKILWRVAGSIMRFYTRRAQLLSRDRYHEPFSWYLFALICRKYKSLSYGVVCKSPEGC